MTTKLLVAAHLALRVKDKSKSNQYTVADDANQLFRMAKRHWRLWLKYSEGEGSANIYMLSLRAERRMRELVKPYRVLLVFRSDPRQATVRIVSGRKNNEVTAVLE